MLEFFGFAILLGIFLSVIFCGLFALSYERPPSWSWTCWCGSRYEWSGETGEAVVDKLIKDHVCSIYSRGLSDADRRQIRAEDAARRRRDRHA